MKPPAVCPVCHEDVPPKAKACPECGADERSGWKEDALLYDGLDLPDASSDDDESSSGNPGETPLIWQIGAVLALAGFLWWIIRGLL